MNSSDLPDRKRPARMPIQSRHNRAEIVFVTVCSKDRKRILATDEVFELLTEFWRDKSHMVVGRFVIMPDHLHLFCAPASQELGNVKKWVGYWKSRVSSRWPRSSDHPIWQEDCWDRQLRTGESYAQKWDYVRNNPVRHGLVEHAEDWPFQGEICELEWHD